MAGPRRGALAGLRGLAVVLAAVFAASAGHAQERPIVIGTGPVAGTYFPAGGAVCSVFNRARAGQGPHCLVLTTSGSRENLERLARGEIDFALVQSDWQYLALRGGDQGDAVEVPELRAVFALQAHAITIVVRPDAGVAALNDLKGRRVNLGPAGSATRAANESFVGALGWSRDDFGAISELGMGQVAGALCAAEIDAFVLPVSHPNGTVAAAVALCGARLLSVPAELVERLSLDWPFYAPATIPAGLYRGQNETVTSYGVRAVLVTLAGVSDDLVFAVTRAVFSDLAGLTRQLPALSHLTREVMTTSGLVAELHRGALRYFQSAAKE